MVLVSVFWDGSISGLVNLLEISNRCLDGVLMTSNSGSLEITLLVPVWCTEAAIVFMGSMLGNFMCVVKMDPISWVSSEMDLCLSVERLLDLVGFNVTTLVVVDIWIPKPIAEMVALPGACRVLGDKLSYQ